LARRFSVSEVANLRQMAEGGRPCIVPDTAAYSGWIPAPSVEGIRSYAGAPIRSKGRILGFLNLNSATAGFFTETHAARLQAFADQAAVALDNARLFDDAVRSAGRTQALYETGRALAALLDEDAVLRTILEAAHRTLGYQYAVISLVDESSQTIGIRHGIWDGQLDAFPGWIEASRYPLSASDILCDICRTGRTEIIAAWDDRFNRDIWERFGHERLLRVFMSIKVRDRVVGVIEAGYDRSTKSSLGEDEVRLLAAFVDQAAAALDNARLFHDVQHRSDELAALLEVTRDLAAHQELPAVLRSIVGHACRLLNTPTGHIYLHDEATGELVLASEIGLPDRQGVRLQPGEGMAGQTAQMRQSLVVDDYRVWPGRSAQFADRPVTSVAQVPLLFGGRLVGILGVGELAPATRRFTEENVRLLTLLAGHAASAVHNAHLYDQVRRHADELDARVAQRTAELQAANEKLEELNRYKSQFVSNVSHELRTPLTNIKFLLELLVTGKPEKRQYYLETVVRETDLLHSLIEDLLLLSRMDLGRLQLELQAVELNQLAGQLAADRTALFAERGLALETRLAPNLPRVQADPRMVKQVLTNLMTNAMNYTSRGGAVTVSTGVQSTWVTLSVGDTGPGISDKELARLFERFFRGEAAHQSKAPGTGLGLAICQEIAQRHRGQITVESQVGVGSVFTLWLPVG
jgi:signal transduction histidine kinase